MRAALTAADLWGKLETTWACLDCELMPWSAKAQELLRTQYAAVGAAGSASLPRAVAALEQAAGRLDGEEKDEARRRSMAEYRRREQDVGRFVAAYRQYCWPVESLTDLKLAPFHLLATEGHVHTDKDHLWHMETLAEVCRADPELLLATPYKVVDVTDPASQAEGVGWWKELTGRGGEGMVVKPLDFIHAGQPGPVQPAVKCRGREYLRIIYGPEYTAEENLVPAAVTGAWAASGRWPSASSPWASRGWSGSCAGSRCGGSTSASSACWPWRASRWTRDCNAASCDPWRGGRHRRAVVH